MVSSRIWRLKEGTENYGSYSLLSTLVHKLGFSTNPPPLVGGGILVNDVIFFSALQTRMLWLVHQLPLVGSDGLAHNDALPTTPWSVVIDWLVDKFEGSLFFNL